MKIGYARISTNDQNFDLQNDSLIEAGCEKIFSDVASGAKTNRPGLDEAIKYCRKDDTLVVWKLDRMGRSISHLIDVINSLNGKNIGFVSLQESIDTTTATGKLIFHIFAALAQFERELIKERVQAGLKAARARGKKGGRKPINNEKIELIKSLSSDKSLNISQICKQLNIGKSTYYKYSK